MSAKKAPPYPHEICSDCGKAHGQRPDGNPHGATWSPGKCQVCGAETYTTEPRDYGHLKPSWILQAKKSLSPKESP